MEMIESILWGGLAAIIGMAVVIIIFAPREMIEVIAELIEVIIAAVTDWKK